MTRRRCHCPPWVFSLFTVGRKSKVWVVVEVGREGRGRILENVNFLKQEFFWYILALAKTKKNVRLIFNKHFFNENKPEGVELVRVRRSGWIIDYLYLENIDNITIM